MEHHHAEHKLYDAKHGLFRLFVPKWRQLPTQISPSFCSIMDETLDDQQRGVVTV